MRGAVVKIISGELVQSVFVCQNANISNGHEITCDWDYPVKPGMPEWAELKNSGEKIAACQIPEEILNSLSTECLTKICLQYPLIYDMFAFNSKNIGFDAFFENFNGIRELYNRETVLNELLKQYHKLINEISPLSGSYPTEEFVFIRSISVLEMLLYGYSQKVDASVENYKNVLLYLTIGYEKKLKYRYDLWGLEVNNINFFARANLIVKLKPESTTSLSYALWGWIMTYTYADIINELSYELIK
jgi:hypothetical protein